VAQTFTGFGCAAFRDGACGRDRFAVMRRPLVAMQL